MKQAAGHVLQPTLMAGQLFTQPRSERVGVDKGGGAVLEDALRRRAAGIHGIHDVDGVRAWWEHLVVLVGIRERVQARIVELH